MKGDISLSDEELLKYADEHIQYELDMLLWSAAILYRLGQLRNKGYLPLVFNNALLNTFSLHARNLTNFLYSRSKGKDFKNDIILEDYLDEEIITKKLTPISPQLENVMEKANKQAAHLSIERIQYEKSGKEWRFIDITKEIVLIFSLLIKHVPKEKMSNKFKQKITYQVNAFPLVQVRQGVNNLSLNFLLQIDSDGKSIKMDQY